MGWKGRNGLGWGWDEDGKGGTGRDGVDPGGSNLYWDPNLVPSPFFLTRFRHTPAKLLVEKTIVEMLTQR